MYQVLSNYDQWGHYIAEFICKYGKQYVGDSEVRIGTTTLNSEWILPMEKRFVAELESRGCIVPSDANARGTIIKPTEQTTYGDQILKLRNAYGGKGANLIVPLQDPISTGRQVAEMKPYKATWNPKWTFGNFAHDGNTALTLMGGEWNPPNYSVRGLSGACYYLSANANNPALCAGLKAAHDQWVSLGNVTFDENAGGSGGNGKASYNFTEANWKADGSGGAAGYQFAYFWHGAMKSIGADPTREKFLAAMNAYDRYSNLITGAISFKGTANKMIGATQWTLIEGAPSCTNGEGDQFCYRQVMDISPGLIDHF
jgi:hypothetical protein